ncbi:hypothetical protein P8452_40810 [Trifolium repens]|nr:hypothetical protein P8452_40810 [Trifolium repens]
MYYKGDPNSFIAMEKTLAFFQGKEPNGLLTEWVMYEYRLETIMKLKVTLFRLRKKQWFTRSSSSSGGEQSKDWPVLDTFVVVRKFQTMNS